MIDTALGGRVAEEIIFGPKEISSGCGSDLVNSTRIAYEMANSCGMIDDKFLLSVDFNQLSQKSRAEIDKKVQQFVDDSLQRTKRLLIVNRDKLDILAKKLLEKETLTGEETIKLLKLD
jgi:ATP-dependent metalloprotease